MQTIPIRVWHAMNTSRSCHVRVYKLYVYQTHTMQTDCNLQLTLPCTTNQAAMTAHQHGYVPNARYP